jgi:DNA-binding transcriptional LysR family regulator
VTKGSTNGHGHSLDDLTSLAAFVQVVEHRSFTAAARASGTTTSSVSKRVARLEERLGVRLVERTTRAFAPTEAGQAFYERSARILQDLEEAEQAVTELGSEPRGTLRITAGAMLGEGPLGPVLGAFSAAYPDLRVEVDLSDRLVNLVEEGFDVGIRGLRIGGTPDSTLIVKKIATVRGVVCAAPSYLARRGVPQRIEDLADHDCLTHGAIPLGRQWSFETPEGTRAAPVRVRLSINGSAALRAAAIAGYGIVRGSRMALGEAIRAGALVPVLEHLNSVELGVFAVHPAGKQALPKVKAFVDFLARELPPLLE